MTLLKERFINYAIIFTLMISSTFNLNFLTTYKPSPIWEFSSNRSIENVLISNDGNYIIAAQTDRSSNSKIYLFNSSNSNPIRVFNYSTLQVAISNDAQYIVIAEESLHLFNRDNSSPLWSYPSPNPANFVDISADGNYIVATMGKNVYLFEKESSSPIWTNTPNDPYQVSRVAISSDGDYIVASADSNLYLFNRSSSIPLWTYVCENYIKTLTISEDGTLIAVGISGFNNKVILFNRNNPVPLKNYSISVRSVDVSSDGTNIVVGGEGRITLLSKNSNTPIWEYSHLGVAGAGFVVALSMNGYEIVAGNTKGSIYLFESDQSTPIWSFKTIHAIYSVSISSDGAKFVAGNYDSLYYFEKSGLYKGYLNVTLLYTILISISIGITILLIGSFIYIRRLKLKKRVLKLLE